MIDIENEVFTIIAGKLRAEFPGIFVTGEFVKAPSSFPCVSLMEMSNSAYRRTMTNVCSENHVTVMYELNVYSNKTTGKKSECKRIAAVVDEAMQHLGFNRSFLNPIPNMEDATIYRISARYRAVVSKDKVIYRR